MYKRQALEWLGKKEKTIILEIDPPSDDISIHRKSFYERCGFKENAFSHVHQMCIRDRSYSFISDAYLAQMEVTNQAVIYIEENSSPLFFSGAWTPPTEREQLIKAAVTAAGQEGCLLYTSQHKCRLPHR